MHREDERIINWSPTMESWVKYQIVYSKPCSFTETINGNILIKPTLKKIWSSNRLQNLGQTRWIYAVNKTSKKMVGHLMNY